MPHTLTLKALLINEYSLLCPFCRREKIFASSSIHILLICPCRPFTFCIPLTLQFPSPTNLPHYKRDWSLFTGKGGGGYKMGKPRVQHVLPPPPPPQEGVHFWDPSSFEGWKLFAPPPPPHASVWLKLQAPITKLLQNVLCPPLPPPHPPTFSMAKTVSAHSFCGGKTLPPPLPFCSPPPLPTPVTNDRSLKACHWCDRCK